jgi:hypothetical protein
MSSETPFSGDVPGGNDDAPYEWLDEWLCEYVDGTMDPSLEAVFEQYVEANPELKSHIQRLKETRKLLCECGLPGAPSDEVEDETCRDEERDTNPPSSPPLSTFLQDRPGAALGLASSVAVALVVGFLVGATVDPTPSPPSMTAPSVSATETHISAPTHTFSPLSNAPLLHPSPAPDDSARAPSPLTKIGLP